MNEGIPPGACCALCGAGNTELAQNITRGYYECWDGELCLTIREIEESCGW